MKISCLIDSLGSGGAQRQMAWLIRALVHKGHQVQLFNYFREFQHFLPDVQAVGVEPQFIDSTSKIGRFWNIRRAIRRAAPDCVISFLNTPNIMAVCSSIGFRKIPVIVSERSLDSKGRTRANWIRFNAFRFADRVVTNSFAQAEFIATNYPFLKKKTVVILNSVDLEKFSPRPLTSSHPEFRILVGASVIPVKNTHRLIEAVKVANQISPRPIKVDWFGNNLFIDGIPTPQSAYYLEALELVRRAGLNDRFVFHDTVRDLESRMHAYDAVCLPSVYEGCPNLVCEGMASGKPVLASKISDLEKIFDRHEFLFNPLDVHSIADCMVKMAAATQERLSEIGRTNRERAEVLFSPQQFSDQFDHLIAEVVGPRSKNSTSKSVGGSPRP